MTVQKVGTIHATALLKMAKHLKLVIYWSRKTIESFGGCTAWIMFGSLTAGDNATNSSGFCNLLRILQIFMILTDLFMDCFKTLVKKNQLPETMAD